MEKQHQVRDMRAGGWFQIDNEIITVHAKKIGVYGVAIYAMLAEMAGKENKTWPGLEYICNTLGISKPTAIKALKLLESEQLISIDQTNKYNIYYLLQVKKTSKSNLPIKPEQVNDVYSQSKGDLPISVNDVYPNKTHITRLKEQEGPAGESARLSVHEQVLVPVFSQIAAALEEPDLIPTSSRLHILRKASANIGVENILKAARNLARSSEVDPHKTYDWLLNKFDYEERITKFMTRKAAGITHTVAPDRAPDGWRLPQ